jgi:hypothetical protein
MAMRFLVYEQGRVIFSWSFYAADCQLHKGGGVN